MLIVPDPVPRSPLLLVGAGAVLLTGLAVLALKRRRRRASSRGVVVRGTWKNVEPAGAPARALAALPARTHVPGATTQNRGRAARKQR